MQKKGEIQMTNNIYDPVKKILISEEPICKLSSTEIRNNIINHKPFTHLLHKKVSDYIRVNGLYGYEE